MFLISQIVIMKTIGDFWGLESGGGETLIVSYSNGVLTDGDERAKN